MDIGRRQFIGGVIGGVGAGLIAEHGLAAGLPCPATGLRVEGGSAAQSASCTSVAELLTPADFSFVGHFDVQTDGLDSPYSRGLTIRRVNGETRLMYLHNGGPWIVEVSLAGLTPLASGSSGQNRVTAITRRWQFPASVRWLARKQIMWDENAGRLWFISSSDYPSDSDDVSTNIYTMTLIDNGLGGSVSNVKRISLEGVPDRRAGTGMFTVPSSYQQRWSVPPYVVGLGSYQSRMSQRGEAAMGPSLFAIPDPSTYPSDAVIPAGQFRTLATRGASPRGRRATSPENYYDTSYTGSRDASGRPTEPVGPDALWRSPGLDGRGYWTWDDTYCGGFLIDGPKKRGIVLVGLFMTGKTYYWESHTNADGYIAEAHIVDPEQAGLVSRGARTPVLDPAAMRVLAETQVNRTMSAPSGSAVYDDVAKQLYVMTYGTGPDVYWNRVYVYGVNA